MSEGSLTRPMLRDSEQSICRFKFNCFLQTNRVKQQRDSG